MAPAPDIRTQPEAPEGETMVLPGQNLLMQEKRGSGWGAGHLIDTP